jgi:hypothetical protein
MSIIDKVAALRRKVRFKYKLDGQDPDWREVGGIHRPDFAVQTGRQNSNPDRIANVGSLLWQLWLALYQILEEVGKLACARAALVCSEGRERSFLTLGHPLAVRVCPDLL